MTLTCRPAALLDLASGRLEKGTPADLAIVDLGTPWMLDRYERRSKAKNSPFDEARFQRRVVRTLVAGETVFPLPH